MSARITIITTIGLLAAGAAVLRFVNGPAGEDTADSAELPSATSGESTTAAASRIPDTIGNVVHLPDRPLPEPAAGEFVIRRDKGGYTIVSNKAWLGEILYELAGRHGFEIENNSREHPFVTVSFRALAIEDAIASLIENEIYFIRYEARRGGERRVTALVIGESESPTGTAAQPGEEGGEASRTKAQDMAKRERTKKERPDRPPRDIVARRAALDARTEREAERRAADLAALGDPDPDRRMQASLWLDPEDSGDAATLGSLLGNDASPEVRAEMAMRLGFAEREVAVPLLVGALGDPSAPVVEEAAWSLGLFPDLGDDAMEALRTVLSHPSPGVRSAAADVLEANGP